MIPLACAGDRTDCTLPKLTARTARRRFYRQLRIFMIAPVERSRCSGNYLAAAQQVTHVRFVLFNPRPPTGFGALTCAKYRQGALCSSAIPNLNPRLHPLVVLLMVLRRYTTLRRLLKETQGPSSTRSWANSPCRRTQALMKTTGAIMYPSSNA